MGRRFVLAIQGLSPEQEHQVSQLFAVGNWWHWISGVWLIVDSTNRLDTQTIRDMVGTVDRNARRLVLEISSPGKLWAGFGPSGGEQDMFRWIREQWEEEEENGLGPQWVTKRAACDLDTVFEQLIQVVERDVKERNELTDADPRLFHKFQVETTDDQCVVYSTDSLDPSTSRQVVFEKKRETQEHGDQIEIDVSRAGRRGRPLLVITLRWNAKKLSCDLLMKNQSSEEQDWVEVWEVSQKALAPLFFF